MSTQPLEAESIRNFTRAYGLLRDPPWLPIAAWGATVPALSHFGYVGSLGYWLLLLAAGVSTALANRWYRRSYGVVAPSQPKPWFSRPEVGVALVVSFGVLEAISTVGRLPVDLALLLFSAYLACAAGVAGGLRKHILVLAAICALTAFLPLVIGDTQLRIVVLQTAFGLGWCFVCVADYRVVRQNFALHGGARHGR